MYKLFILSFIIMSAYSFKAPDFCHGLDCPEFKLISSQDNIEIREYSDSFWVSTLMKSENQDDLKRKGFWTLFNYINGKNEKKEKISMTSPVLLKVNSSNSFTKNESIFTMSFFLGYKNQNEFAPKPEDSNTFLEKLESRKYGVISYSGFNNKKKQEEHLSKLSTYLLENNYKFNENYYFVAGYDSPFKLFFRHNEVWIELL